MKNKKILILCFIFLVGTVVFKTVFFSPSSNNSANISGSVNIPVSEITSQAKWYEYDIGKEEIKFFVIKADDGTIRTAFDACDVCYKEKKGYRQEGNYMVCNNCGNRYPISGLGTENKTPGGCWPGYLSSTVEGDNLIIKKADLENS